MRKMKIALIVSIISLFCVTSYAAQFYDIDKPGIKKKDIYLDLKETSRQNKVFQDYVRRILDQSLLLQINNNKSASDYSLAISGRVEDKEIIFTISGVKETDVKPSTFGVRLRSDDTAYLQLKAAQIGNWVLKELFGIDGSFGSTITWSNMENGRKVLYRAAFGLPESTEQISYNLFTNYGAQFSPDARDIIYTSHMEKGTAITYQQVQPLLLKTFSIYPDIGVASSPDWAPDGTIFLTIHKSEQNSDIVQFKLPTNPYQKESQLERIRQWTFDKTIETEPRVSPDGKQMAYVADATGAPQIYILDFNSGKAKRLTKEGGYNVTPAWSPNGKLLAYRGIRNGISSIYRIDVRTGQEKRVTPTTLDAEAPTWSPDGSLIAFSAKPAGKDTDKEKVYYILSSGGEYRELATPQSHVNLSNPSWGPALQ